MIVVSCSHQSTKKHGKDKNGKQRFRCLDCGKTWIDRTAQPLGDMRISMQQATQALGMILEGMSIRATMRLTGLDGGTICNLIVLDCDEDRICTSHIERMNLSVRMQLRRFTRLTNGHSKSPRHQVAMQALYFAWYNF